MQERQEPQEQGPLPRSREAVDWWLKKWGLELVIDGLEPLTQEDLDRLVEINGGTMEGLILPVVNFQGLDLDGVDLQGAKLGGGNLQVASLSEANLQGADLSGAGLQGAILGRANLQAANLSEANLQGADLRAANLQDANLTRTRISPATNLEGVKWDKDYVRILERERRYEAAASLYRQLKEWYDRAGMRDISGEFHYREREAARKAQWQSLSKEVKEFKQSMMTAWRRLRGRENGAS